jgi:nucleoside-diphosphate-sugar epimerase
MFLRRGADITKAKALLGYAPRTPYLEGVERFIEWFVSTRESKT